jgi:hypothetical protein
LDIGVRLSTGRQWKAEMGTAVGSLPSAFHCFTAARQFRAGSRSQNVTQQLQQLFA